MILTCNSCSKKFVVPDSAITASGRTVQCGSCGNKWKQFPINKMMQTQSFTSPKNIVSKTPKNNRKIQNQRKTKKNVTKKRREINLYSPEYLAKKHGIKLNEINDKPKNNKKVSFGFYGSVIILIVIVIAISRGLYFFQDFIITKLPFTEYYLEYFFESIRNMFEIWKNLISSY